MKRHLLVSGSIVLALGSASLAQKSDERFESENVSTIVHPPALASKPRPALPFKGRKADYKAGQVIDCANLKAVAGRLKKDSQVGGKILSRYVPKGGSPLILNFGNPKQCFKAVIFEDDFHQWGATKPDEIAQLYVGKIVVAGGYINEHEGDLQIAISVPSQLIVISD